MASSTTATPPEGPTTRWFRRSSDETRPAGQSTGAEIRLVDSVAPFVCSTCGRSDLPEAGGWDPPICQECDAAINEDALRESLDGDG
jgi:hypothetical protein